MISRKAAKFAVKPVVAAVALALTAAGAYAAPTPNQMPGGGQIAAVSAGSGLVVGAAVVNIPNGATGTVDGQIVIRWGVSGLGEVTNPLGFNLGAGATINFTSSVAGGSLLNVDVSGNASQIYGNLVANNTGGFTPSLFVANANGIVVGAGGRIVAPAGVGLIGANMDSALQFNEFTGNNTPSRSYIDVIGGQSSVQVHGAINGDLALNLPAAYVLLAGGNITNTGNIYALDNFIQAGLRGAPGLATVNGVTGVTVNRLWDVTISDLAMIPIIGTSAPFSEIATAGSSFVNTGSMSAAGPGGYIFLGASGDIRSGTAGSTDTQVGLFADSGVLIDSYSNSSKVELYNVISGYTTNKTLPELYVNAFSSFSGFAPDVTINALTPGAQPSSITTTGPVSIFGGNVAINSTINHKDKAGGGTQGNVDLTVNGSKSVTIAANVGAGRNVLITSGGPLTISGNVLSDTNTDTSGGIYVNNNGADAPTTITGNLLVPSSVTLFGGTLQIDTNGPTTISGNLTSVNNVVDVHNFGTGVGNFTVISGNVTSGQHADIYNYASANPKPLTISGNVSGVFGVNIYNYGSSPGNTTTITGNVTSGGYIDINHYSVASGQLTISGTLSAGGSIYARSGGNASVGVMNAGGDIDIEIFGTSLHLMGALTAGDDVDINARTATTLAYPAAVITAPTVYLDVLNFVGVNAAGLPYATLAEKPAAQIVTNELDVDITGSINAPIAGNTNWLNNSVMVAPFSPLSSVEVSVSATGGGFQAVNIGVNGNLIADSGTTTTPFIGVPLTTGGFPAGGLQGNVGSSLILHASGSVTMIGAPTGSLFGPPLAFQFPGGIAVKAGTTLTTMAPVYNAWTTVAIPFQGQWYEAPYIVIGSFLATSGNTWTNFSSAPVSGFPTTYQIREINPSSYGFALAPEAVHKNTYSAAILGGPICMTGGPTTFTVCP